jgi:hypothetical protein
MWFHGRKKKQNKSFDPEKVEPAIRCSICTGEQTAGFRDRKTGEFYEICVIRNDEELQKFKREYGIDGEIRRFY